MIMNIHDEGDYRCLKDHAEDAIKIIKDAARRAGEYYKLNVAIDVDVKVGSNWAEVH